MARSSNNHRRNIQLTIVVLLFLGIGISTLVVQNRTNLFSKAAEIANTSGNNEKTFSSLTVAGHSNFAGSVKVDGLMTANSGIMLQRGSFPQDTCRPATTGLIITSDANYTLADPVVQACSTTDSYNTHVYMCGARWDGTSYKYGWICMD